MQESVDVVLLETIIFYLAFVIIVYSYVMHKKLSKKIETSRKLFSDIALSVGDWIWEMNRDWRYTHIYGRFEEVVGLKESDIIGKKITEMGVLSEQAAEKLYENYTNMIKRNEDRIEFEQWIVSKRGDRRLIHVSAVAFKNKHGKVIGFRGVNRDITKQKKLQDEVRNNKNFINKLQEAAQVGSWSWNLLSNVIHHSDQMERIFGYSLEELPNDIKELMDLLVHPMDKRYVLEVINRVAKTGIGEFMEFRFRKKKSSEIHWLRCETPWPYEIDEHGQVIQMVGIVKDVTEQKKAEERILHAQTKEKTANEISKVKSEFLANLSHELRTPMHGILSFARYGISDAMSEDVSREELLQDFEEIKDSGERLLDLLNDLLDLSKIEIGSAEYYKEENDITLVVDIIISDFYRYAEEKDVKIIMEAPADGMVAYFDYRKMQQVVSNLLFNAIKFSKVRGTITVEVKKEQRNAVDFLKVSVINEGSEIVEDELESIFKRYVKRDKDKKHVKGAGLGLSIAKKIIEDHHGQIWVEDSTDGETRFCFVVPCHQIRNKVLIVDDEEGVRDLLATRVAEHGFEIIESSNGREALEKIKNEMLVGVIADVKMPEMGGVEMVKRMRKDGRDCNILLISGVQDLSTDELVTKGEVDFLEKPLSNESLTEYLKKVA